MQREGQTLADELLVYHALVDGRHRGSLISCHPPRKHLLRPQEAVCDEPLQMGLMGGGREPLACGLARLLLLFPLTGGGADLPFLPPLEGGDLGAAPAAASAVGSLATRHRWFIRLEKGERVGGSRDRSLQQWRFSQRKMKHGRDRS